MIMRESVPAQPGKVKVTFSLPASLWAEHVQLTGDFDGMNAVCLPLRRDEAGWSVSLLLERDRAYSYYYQVDEERLVDWNVDGHKTDNDGRHQAIVIARPPLAPCP